MWYGLSCCRSPPAEAILLPGMEKIWSLFRIDGTLGFFLRRVPKMFNGLRSDMGEAREHVVERLLRQDLSLFSASFSCFFLSFACPTFSYSTSTAQSTSNILVGVAAWWPMCSKTGFISEFLLCVVEICGLRLKDEKWKFSAGSKIGKLSFSRSLGKVQTNWNGNLDFCTRDSLP